jgi:hypothetical protein
MAALTTVSVYAINLTTYTTPISVGIQTSNVRSVNPVRNGAGAWIGKYQPSSYNLIYSEIVVGADQMTSDVNYYYANRTVAQMITALNT